MSEPPSATGRVYLVGAGPGDPALLTLRAVECLAEADLVIYDRLVPAAALRYAPQARQVAVADLPGPHAEKLPKICQLMIEAARRGERVVRLKGGDPWIFGRGAEEATALRAAGIAFEVVPGVTAAVAAATGSGIPLTDRRLASHVTLVTGHECPEKGTSVDWASLARLPGTLAIYMGLGRLEEITTTLIRHGRSARSPAACIEWAGTNRQRTVVGTLEDLPERVRSAGIHGPVIIFVGEVVRLREQLQWLERLPLFGKTVIVTRPRHQAAELIRRLERLGACVLHQPVVEIGPPPDPAEVDAVLDRLHEFDWLVFTSVNGVSAFLNRLLDRGHDLRRLGHLKLAAIGSQTAAALHRYHLRADYTPETFTSEALANGLIPQVREKRVLLARADRGREVLLETLREVCSVRQLAVYSQRDVERLEPAVAEALGSGQPIFVMLSSSNIARGFLGMLGPRERTEIGKTVHLVSISPITSAAIRELGFAVAGEAEQYTAEGLVEALVRLAATSSP